MQITVTGVDYAPAELHAQLPIVADLIREMPGDDRNDYWLAKPHRPIIWHRDVAQRAIHYLIVTPRWERTSIESNVRHLPVGIAYVTDDTLVDDARLDFDKCSYVAIGFLSDTTNG